jgi:hypothetical protein
MKVIALLSTAAVALAFDNQPDARPRTVPGAYIYEFEDGYVWSPHYPSSRWSLTWQKPLLQSLECK